MLICVCLRILVSSRIPRYDLGRQIPLIFEVVLSQWWHLRSQDSYATSSCIQFPANPPVRQRSEEIDVRAGVGGATFDSTALTRVPPLRHGTRSVSVLNCHSITWQDFIRYCSTGAIPPLLSRAPGVHEFNIQNTPNMASSMLETRSVKTGHSRHYAIFQIYQRFTNTCEANTYTQVELNARAVLV
jgi:hypothetical protein